MCVPAAGVAAVGLGLQVFGVLGQAGAARDAAVANRAGYQHQSAVETHKAGIYDQQAADAIARGKQAAFTQQLKTAQLRSTQRARFAAAGLDLNEGSAFNVLMDTDFMGKMDEAVISDNAEREAWAFRESARTSRSNADFLAGRAGMESPSRAQNVTLLGGGGQVASSWYRLYR